jgi:branched-chain amino acid transport system ATP-binding protein
VSAPALVAQDLQACYGASQILFGVNLEVGDGEIVAFLGRNGAGKTTTFRALIGLLPLQRGQVTVAGRRVDGMRPHLIARLGVGYVPEDRQVFIRHTVEENLEIGAKPGPDGKIVWNLERVYATFPLLKALRTRLAGKLSGGEQQILAIARSLMGNPSILLLDEPSEGLAPIIVQQIAQTLLELRKIGLTVLLAEQNMHFGLHVATRVSVIEKGIIVYNGTVDEFRANDDVKTKYLSA